MISDSTDIIESMLESHQYELVGKRREVRTVEKLTQPLGWLLGHGSGVRAAIPPRLTVVTKVVLIFVPALIRIG